MNNKPFVVKCKNPTIRTTKDSLYIATEEGSKSYLIRCDTGAWVWLGRNRFEVVGDAPETSEPVKPRKELADALRVLIAHNTHAPIGDKVFLESDEEFYHNGEYYAEHEYDKLLEILELGREEISRRRKLQEIEEAKAKLEELHKEYSELS